MASRSVLRNRVVGLHMIGWRQATTVGALIKSVTKSYQPNYFIQMPVGDLMGAPAGPDSSLVFSITQGSAVIYGAGVENSGKGMTLQIASPANE